ncbi:nickel-dependent lactate racemase [Crassaminicella profunda]|uniref:nickel-dependent lactate racemase n=1 Tax=Crassaminicella profunda TaxID=1286698 RepID=UPI001CA6C4CC|nr:nickel-dependent lactate racemase [Crassaminicella profunda]QZY56199.1 nickel-dependent lactate racemase [Crassaminicella profunda]
MRTIKLPYYKEHIDLNIDEKNLKAVLMSNAESYKVKQSQEAIVNEALENPIHCKKLRELAKGKEKVVIITSDHTRPVPSHITLPILLKEIRKGNPNTDITILIATGLHRATTTDEMFKKYGEEVVNNEKMVIHDAFISEDMVKLGTLPSGSNCSINRLAAEADLLVCEGFIEPHFFAGFSGGRKSILPGVSSKETVNANHSARAIAHPLAKTGVLKGNPIHEDMIYAARKVGVDFILNVILDADKNIIEAVAGDVNDAHLKGCEFITKLSGVDKEIADIVITTNGGYPLDQNLYQCPKAISAAVACAKENGVIIMVASCVDGLGGENFGKLMLKGSPKELMEYVTSIPDEETISEQWCVQKFADILLKYKLILVTEYLDYDLIKRMNIIPASTIDEAMKKAYEIQGKDASVTVIPDGVSVIVKE